MKGKTTNKGYAKKPYKKPKWYRKKYDAIGLAKKALQGLWYVKGMINCEKHKMEFSDISGYNIPNTGNVSLLSGIAIDDTDSGRTGNSILARGLYYNYLIRNATSSPQTSSIVRIIIFQDTQQVSDSFPISTTTGLLEYTSGPRVVNSPLDSNTVGRFNILYDRTHNLDTVNEVQKKASGYIPLRTHLRYNGSSSSDVQKNNIYMISMADTTTGALNNPVMVSFVSRLYFYDN